MYNLKNLGKNFYETFESTSEGVRLKNLNSEVFYDLQSNLDKLKNRKNAQTTLAEEADKYFKINVSEAKQLPKKNLDDLDLFNVAKEFTHVPAPKLKTKIAFTDEKGNFHIPDDRFDFDDFGSFLNEEPEKNPPPLNQNPPPMINENPPPLLNNNNGDLIDLNADDTIFHDFDSGLQEILLKHHEEAKYAAAEEKKYNSVDFNETLRPFYIKIQETIKDIELKIRAWFAQVSNFLKNEPASYKELKEEYQKKKKLQFEEFFRFLDGVAIDAGKTRVTVDELNSFKGIFIEDAKNSLRRYFMTIDKLFDIICSSAILVIAKMEIIKNMGKDNEALKKEIDELYKLKQTYTQNRDPTSVDAVKKLIAEVENRDMIIKELNVKIDSFQQVAEELQALIISYEEKINIETQKKSELERKIIELQKKNEDIEYKFKNSLIQTGDPEMVQLAEESYQNRQRIIEYQKQLDKEQSEKRELHTLLQNLDKQNIAAQLEIDATRRENAQTIIYLQDQNRELGQKVQFNTEIMKQLLSALGIDEGNYSDSVLFNKIRQIQELHTQKELFYNQHKELQLYASKLETEKKDLVQRIIDSSNKEQQLQQEIIRLNNELQQLVQKYNIQRENKEIVNKNISYITSLINIMDDLMTDVSLFVEDGNKRINNYYNQFLTPFYSFITKKDAFFNLVVNKKNSNIGHLNIIPLPTIALNAASSFFIVLWQLYYTALIHNCQKMIPFYFYVFTDFSQSSFKDDLIHENQAIANLLVYLEKTKAHFNPLLQQAYADQNNEEIELTKLVMARIQKYSGDCALLKKSLNNSTKKIANSKKKLNNILGGGVLQGDLFKSIVINMYTLYSCSSQSASFYSIMGYEFYSEFLELIGAKQKVEGIDNEQLVKYSGINYNEGLYYYSVTRNIEYVNSRLQSFVQLSEDVFPITQLQMSLSPLAIIGRIKVLIRNKLIVNGCAIKFSHNIAQIRILDSFFWRSEQIAVDDPRVTQFERRTPIFIVRGDYFVLQDSSPELIADLIENVHPEHLFMYFYAFISRTLLWLIQQIQSEIYFVVPNTTNCVAILNSVEKMCNSLDMYETLNNSKFIFRQILEMLCVGYIADRWRVETPLQYDPNFANVVTIGVNSMLERDFKHGQLPDIYYSFNDEHYFVKAEVQYKKQTYFKIRIENLPLQNFYVWGIKTQYQEKNLDVLLKHVGNLTFRLNESKYDNLPTRRKPYEHMLDMLPRHVALSNAYEIIRKFAYYYALQIHVTDFSVHAGKDNLDRFKKESIERYTPLKITEEYKQFNNSQITNPFLLDVFRRNQFYKKFIYHSIFLKTQNMILKVLQYMGLERYVSVEHGFISKDETIMQFKEKYLNEENRMVLKERVKNEKIFPYITDDFLAVDCEDKIINETYNLDRKNNITEMLDVERNKTPIYTKYASDSVLKKVFGYLKSVVS